MLAPRSTAGVWAAYLAWALSLTGLVLKRCARLRVNATVSIPAKKPGPPGVAPPSSGKKRRAAARAQQQRQHARKTQTHTRLALPAAFRGWLFVLYERAVERHAGSGLLWRAYLAALADAGAARRWRKVAARALRMRPADAGLWVLVGERTARGDEEERGEEGKEGQGKGKDGGGRKGRKGHTGEGGRMMVPDMERARAIFVRGCGFCNSGEDGLKVWVAYARCEMEWLKGVEEKLAKKRGKIGVANAIDAPLSRQQLDVQQPGQLAAEMDVDVQAALDGSGADPGDEFIRFSDNDDSEDEGPVLPDFPAASLARPSSAAAKSQPAPLPEASASLTVAAAAATTAASTAANPALSGALPRAIFDIALKQAFFGVPAARGATKPSPDLAVAAFEAFFLCFGSYWRRVSSAPMLVQHVLDSMSSHLDSENATLRHPATAACRVRQPVEGVPTDRPEFAAGLRESMRRMYDELERSMDRKALAERLSAWMQGIMDKGALDPGIKEVCEIVVEELKKERVVE